MSEKIKILIVEHDPYDLELLHLELKNGGINYEYELVQDEAGLVQSLTNYLPDIILSDFSLPSFNGAVALEVAQKISPLVPFILVSGAIGEEKAVEIIKNGATDYVLKDKLVSLPHKIVRALNEQKEKQEKLVAETEQIKMTDDLIQRNKNLEQFAYIVSHNLRAPVAKIMGLSDLLQIKGVSAEDIKKIMTSLIDSVESLDNIIKDLNVILRARTDLNEKREMVKFTDMVNEILNSIRSASDKDKDNVKVKSDFSSAAELLTLKSYLHSIFYNLISNSIKYRRPDVEPLIEIKSEKKGGNIELQFKDNGLGIDLNKNGEKLFGLYKRFHTHVDGKGMGLFMVKTQVETLDGKINVESTPGEGTTFTILFKQ